MNIIFFTHPSFLGHQSMPRYAQWLAWGMQERGHRIAQWTPKARFVSLPVPKALKKWMGYLDQYVLFPWQVRRRLKQVPTDTLFVFTDHALGPWVPLVKHRRHVVHCHDFLAQRSALGLIQENPTGWTGQIYQNFIWKGYARAQNFISISHQTQRDLHTLLERRPACSEVVYNGVKSQYRPGSTSEARQQWSQQLQRDVTSGYLLHVGGNQWYKNRMGLLELYTAWRNQSRQNLPLLCIGEAPNAELEAFHEQSPYRQDIYFLTQQSDADVVKAYQGATAFVFPSLAEGFGWPIAEAMAAGCPVITTQEAPMTEVAGGQAFLIPRQQVGTNWAQRAAGVLEAVVTLTPQERRQVIEQSLANAQRFNAERALDVMEEIYQQIVEKSVDYVTP